MEAAENFYNLAAKPETFDRKAQIIQEFINQNKQNKIVLVTVKRKCISLDFIIVIHFKSNLIICLHWKLSHFLKIPIEI